MCSCHPMPRRDFAKLLLGLAGASLLPVPVLAAGHAEALALTCIDYRLAAKATRFFDTLHLAGDYDQVALAGASLAAVSKSFPTSNAAFWDQLELARKLHDVKKLIVLDHRDCGAYKAAFGDAFAGFGAAEGEQHRSVLTDLRTKLAARHPNLSFEGWLMALDGHAERLL